MDTNGREDKGVHPTAEERRLIFENPLPDSDVSYLPASVSLVLFVFIRVHSWLIFSLCPLCLCGEIHLVGWRTLPQHAFNSIDHRAGR